MNIVEKEKARQITVLDIKDNKYLILLHKASLINLKEYMEEEIKKFEKMKNMIKTWHVHIDEEGLLCSEIDRVFIVQLKEDIKELIKMIEVYK